MLLCWLEKVLPACASQELQTESNDASSDVCMLRGSHNDSLYDSWFGKKK